MVTMVLQMVSMEYKFTKMAKSLLTKIFAVTLVFSLIAGGLAHAEVPSCLLLPQDASTLDSGIDQSGTIQIAKVNKKIDDAAMSHKTKSGSSQNNFQCCDNWCPLLFTTTSENTASNLKFQGVHVPVPQGSLLSAHGKGLERPPKTFL